MLEEVRNIVLMLGFGVLCFVFAKNLVEGMDSGEIALRNHSVKEEENPKTYAAYVAANGCYTLLAAVLCVVFFIIVFDRTN